MVRKLVLVLAAVIVASFPLTGWGAETVHLYLKVNGKDIQGESTQQSLGRAGSIECVYYEQKGIMTQAAGSGMSTGRRQYEPILIRKRIDKSTPILKRAFAKNEVVEGTFKFFRPSPAGDGTTQQFYTVSFGNGRIASVKDYVPDASKPETSNLPPFEEVTFIFSRINWTYTDGKVTSEDNLSGR